MSYGKYDDNLFSGNSPVSVAQYQTRQLAILNELYNTHLKGRVKFVAKSDEYGYPAVSYIGIQDRYIYHLAEAFRDMRADIVAYRTTRKALDTETGLDKRRASVSNVILKSLNRWKPSVSWDVSLGEPSIEAVANSYRSKFHIKVKAGWPQIIYEKGLDVVSDKFVMQLDDIENIDSFEGAKMCKATVFTLSNIRGYNDTPKCLVEQMYLSWLVIDDQFTKTGRPYTGLGKSARTSQAALKRSVLGAIKKEML
mgnify:CR=1 FL=1